MSKAFDGIRVIDTTHVLAGPFASYQMAVLGAEVIKVESPNNPDQARMQGSDRSLNDCGLGTAFMTQASNKKALALDLKTPEGCEAMKRLITTADVLVENYRPGAFDELGLGFDEMSKLNPKLIYCSISAFGSTGPRREQTAYDNVIQAFSGMMAMTGHGDGRPLKSGAPMRSLRPCSNARGMEARASLLMSPCSMWHLFYLVHTSPASCGTASTPSKRATLSHLRPLVAIRHPMFR
jgi:crotonobetainyl-CoA:carnitine CoA-transferase CaiB-like acyl-CoA transferase